MDDKIDRCMDWYNCDYRVIL